MPRSARSTAMLLAATATLLATAATAEERCSGTLCDFYYGNSAPETPKAAAAPTPLTVPSGGILGFFSGTPAQPAAPGQAPAPAKRPLVGVQGGGVVGLMNGAPQERCGGTLCDLYYGGPPPERPEQPVDAQPRAPAPREADAGAPEPEAEPTPRRSRRAAEAGVRYERPQCVAPPGDPWRCYR